MKKHHLKHPATLALTVLALVGLAVTAIVALPSEASTAPDNAALAAVTAPARQVNAAHQAKATKAKATKAKAAKAKAAEARRVEAKRRRAAADHAKRIKFLDALRDQRRIRDIREIARQRQVAAEAAAKAAAQKAAAARAAEAKAAAQRAPAPTVNPPAAAPTGGGRCGGNLPPCCVMNRESGGNIHAQNPRSSASGKWQFLDSTWGGYGGYASAKDAPESVQDARAAQLWAGGAGAGHWGGGC